MENSYEQKIRIKKNMKLAISITKDTNLTLINLKGEKFYVTKNNMFISEQKTSNQERSFVISIRNDGEHGEYKMGQLTSLSEKDLIMIRNSINIMLNKYKF